MELLYISTFMFHKEESCVYALPSCSDSFFEKYLDVFSSVYVLGEEVRSYLDKSALVKMKDQRIKVDIIERNTHPKDFVNDKIVQKKLKEAILQSDAILIKPASRRGMMAIKIAESLNKPYMIEMTGDIHNAMRQNPNIVKKLYAPILYRQIKKSIKNCKYGLYVSESYLQEQFPIKGNMCGCSDVILKDFDDEILKKRIQKIRNYTEDSVINLGLIGFYQGKMKGVDTAIRALGRLNSRYHLHVLGNGTEENRKKWYEYGKKHGVDESRIHFPKPLPSSGDVQKWLDEIDMLILPTLSEGFPRVVVEAMSRGCPCLATNICSLPELLPKECLFEIKNDIELSNLIQRYFLNFKEMEYQAKRNYKKSREYETGLLRCRRNDFLSGFKDYCCKSGVEG